MLPLLSLRARLLYADSWIMLVRRACYACKLALTVFGLIVLSSCSAVRLSYDNAPQLLHWWLDDYVDFDSSQSARVKADLNQLHEWHRSQELPHILALLQTVQAAALQDVSADQLCSWYEQGLERVKTITTKSLPLYAATVSSLRPQQLDSLERVYQKDNKKWTDQWLAGALQKRNQKRLEKTADRLTMFYGNLSQAQEARLKNYIDQGQFDPEMSLREIKRRQQDTLLTFKAARGLSSPDAIGLLVPLLQRDFDSPNPEFIDYRDKNIKGSCALGAALHNSMSAKQRNHFSELLKGYIGDIQYLHARK